MKRKAKKQKEKPKTKRSSNKYPALKPELNLKIRYELIDYDYIDKLNPEEKEWLNKFTNEYVNDVLDRKNLKNNLHNTKELKKDCDDRNNARNRDILSKSKAMSSTVYLEDIKELHVQEEKQLEDSYDLDDATNNTHNNSEESDEF